MIYGAGNAGRQLASAIENSKDISLEGFLDDDRLLQNQYLLGKMIYSTNNLKRIIKEKQITHILIAMPSISRSDRLKILKKLNYFNIIIRTLPSFIDLAEGRISFSDIKDLDVEDILEREIVKPDINLLNENTKSKIVLVTGAGGSIGSELSRQILKCNPKKLILIEINEYSLYKISQQLEEIKNNSSNKINSEIVPLLASVQDENRIRKIIQIFKPSTLYHAAAYKHVPIVEENICEGVKNNVFGSLVTCKIAIENKVSNIVLVSSDKAVRPTNIMGASKRVAELCLQALYNNDVEKKSKICIVRFGNVLESSGSIIPKFKKQILDGGPLTLTHPDVTRFFMTITEASQLVIQAGAMTEDCNIFILDMGKEVKIIDLLKKIVKLSGLTIKDDNNLEGDIAIKIIGLRPGEKLYEELLLGKNQKKPFIQKSIKQKENYIDWNELRPNLEELKIYTINGEVKKVIDILKNVVEDYKPSHNIVDKTYN